VKMPTFETTSAEPVAGESITPAERPRDLEPGLLSMIVAAVVLLIAVGVVLWTVSSTPNGPSVTVTIRNP
jgi:hypothetical protein